MTELEMTIKALECCAHIAHMCRDCPMTEYRRRYNAGEGCDCHSILADKALKMLMEKESRVMTLEEVKMLDSDYYYLESMRSPGKELREIVGAYGLTCVTWPSITWARQTMGDSGYGKTWRCWTERPTEAQREAATWKS